MVGPAVNAVADVAARALAALDGEGQVLVVREAGTTTVTVTAVHEGRAASAATTGSGDEALARAAKRAAVQARRMRALPAPPLPRPAAGPAASGEPPWIGPATRAGVPEGFTAEVDAGTAEIAVRSTTGLTARESRGHAIVRIAAERAGGRAVAVTVAAPAAADQQEAVAEARALLGEGDAAGPFAPHVPAGAPRAPRDEDLQCLVLGPEAVAVVLDHLRPAFGVDAALGAGPALGDTLAAAGIGLADDARHPGTLQRAYDAEGVPRRRVALIDQGRVAGRVHDAASAHRANTGSTGHATRPLTLAPLPEHLVLDAGGDADGIGDLIAGVERGLFVPALTRRGATVGAARIAGGALTGAVRPRALELGGVLARVRRATLARRLVALPPHCPGGKGAALVPALRCDA